MLIKKACLTTGILISLFTCGSYLCLGTNIHWKMFWHLLWVFGIEKSSLNSTSVHDLLIYKERVY